jgi:hypothetical protein
MAKVDFFKADKGFSKRVVEYMDKKVWAITLKTRYRKDIEKLESDLVRYDEVLNSTDVVGEEELKSATTLKLLALKKIDETTKKYQEQVEKEGKFEWNDADKKFYDVYKDKGVAAAITEFCALYGLNVENTDLLLELEQAISGARRATAKTIIQSGAKTFTSDIRTKGDVLGIVYGRLAEKMIAAGTIKAADIPDDIKAAYAPKAKKSNK